MGIPKKIEESEKLESEIGLVVDPIVALKREVKIKAGNTIELNLILSISEEKTVAIDKLYEYRNFENVKKAFEISKIKTEEESRYLRLKGEDIILYQKILSYIIKFNPMKKDILNKLSDKKFSQKNLWKYGISGDLPIILVKVKEENDLYIVREILKAYEYYMTKKIVIDLIILYEETNIHEKYVRNELEKEIYTMGLNYLIDNKIFIIEKKEVKDIDLFEFNANIILDSYIGSLKNLIAEKEVEYVSQIQELNSKKELELEDNFKIFNIDNMDLKYKNSYGGFENDGMSYIISTTKNVPSVWSNVLTNGRIGTIITQNLGGYTWSKNSRLNRITRWSNDTILDIPSESIYIRNFSDNKVWRISEGSHLTTYGFGYANYKQENESIKHELTLFVPIKYDVKINILKIKNNTNKYKKINIIYKIDDVLGEDELKTNGYLNLKYNKKDDYIVIENLYEQEVSETVFMYCSEKIKSFTGNNSSINLYRKESLNNENSLGNNSCAAIEIEIELRENEEKEISFVLGTTKNFVDTRFKDINKCKEELLNTKKYWSYLIGKIRVNTPVESFNIMINGWSMYQTISSRIMARSGFYQSGGAYGFRDQLQDCIGIEYVDTDIVKKQIIKHARHQFIEGDVEHWWHEESKRGIRTKFSDDRLWLVYLVLDYIDFTGDYNILEEQIEYIKGNVLKENEDENYDIHEQTEKKESLYLHCIRAINISLKFGENGLPLIGTGDWNDGFNTIGNKGKGESVWLGFFLYDILNRFIKIVKLKQDTNLVNGYKSIIEKLKQALNTIGWDGNWYKRAFSDDKKTLGSNSNDECKIDSISQSWAVISEAGDKDKNLEALHNLEKYLIDEKNGIIKLLYPPFENSCINPGYIKSYLPGVRENGGQYTHAAIWAIIAFSKLEIKDKAEKLFTMINPIEHSSTKEKQNIYKIEPYVIPADIYGSKNLLGRGGWSWYTGSSSWYYRCGIQNILGININKNKLTIKPCVPDEWKEYSFRYRYGNSIYNLKILNKFKSNEVKSIRINGSIQKEKFIVLIDNNKIYDIQITI